MWFEKMHERWIEPLGKKLNKMLFEQNNYFFSNYKTILYEPSLQSAKKYLVVCLLTKEFLDSSSSRFSVFIE